MASRFQFNNQRNAPTSYAMGFKFPQGYSSFPDNMQGSLYDYKKTPTGIEEPGYPVATLRRMRLHPELYQQKNLVAPPSMEVADRVEVSAQKLQNEMNNIKKDKVEVLMDETVSEMKKNGKVKRKDMLKVLDKLNINK